MTIDSGVAHPHTRFDVRRHIADVLGGERDDFDLARAPHAGYRGLEADYSHEGAHAASVLITQPLSGRLVRPGIRRVTERTPNDLLRIALPAAVEIDW